jgi:hypothetical protein
MKRGAGVFLLLFAAASLAAVAVGAAVSARSGVADALWIRNLAAWAVGGLIAFGLSFLPRGALAAAPWLLVAGLAASFLSPPLDGVHRWIDLGPLHLNAAMVLLPMAVVSLAARGSEPWPKWIAAFLSLALLVAQPDASQTTTLAAGMVLVAGASSGRPIVRLSLVAAAALLAGAAWSRPDPLQPVPEVEQIIGLAYGWSPVVAGVALLALGVTAATPVLAAPSGVRMAGAALGLCLLVWSIVPFLGAFPVPLVGIGMGPIFGAWLGAGVLAALMRAERA